MKYYSAIGGRARCGDIVALVAEPVVLFRANPDRPFVRGARKGIAATELAVLLPFLAFIFVIAIDFALMAQPIVRFIREIGGTVCSHFRPHHLIERDGNRYR